MAGNRRSATSSIVRTEQRLPECEPDVTLIASEPPNERVAANSGQSGRDGTGRHILLHQRSKGYKVGHPEQRECQNAQDQNSDNCPLERASLQERHRQQKRSKRILPADWQSSVTPANPAATHPIGKPRIRPVSLLRASKTASRVAAAIQMPS